jgi:hypothetical protein
MGISDEASVDVDGAVDVLDGEKGTAALALASDEGGEMKIWCRFSLEFRKSLRVRGPDGVSEEKEEDRGDFKRTCSEPVLEGEPG